LEKRRDYLRRWMAAHPGYRHKYNHMRRLKTRVATDPLVDRLILIWKKERSFICYYCQRKHSTKNLEIDHIVPICRGGIHTCENICRSCKTCNRRKKSRSLSELRFLGQMLLPV
jgi:5-methylcytosine-specific restriction endonuclease McrA